MKNKKILYGILNYFPQIESPFKIMKSDDFFSTATYNYNDPHLKLQFTYTKMKKNMYNTID